MTATARKRVQGRARQARGAGRGCHQGHHRRRHHGARGSAHAPAPTDRDAAERELNQLVRQINNLGPVNQVAMEEYEQLKRRADYIEEQLADSRARARRSPRSPWRSIARCARPSW
ncbi:MAG: hypothetical protein ACLTYW_02175 [Collinsella sp.]